MKYAILASLFVAAAAPFPAALAAEPAATLRISLDDIDLTTPRGTEAAQRRIDRAVGAFCRNDVEHLSLGGRRSARQCREAARRDAFAQLGSQRAQQLAAR
ncbi:UrcA family protein [Sphingopyxis sp. KK2]|uniref:UrcA family protein n=1 Tax=Sphingopyxis sp. KK2 TaxID=1855727 RepID=UPI00097E6528|nr:UrcA family protein [Sphingopyxis sp. KK2]